MQFFSYFDIIKIIKVVIMQRYFVKEKQNNNFILFDSDIHHIKNVMRNKINDKIEVVYEEKVYLCNIKELEPIFLEILKEYTEDREMPINLTIAVSLVQEQKFDLILQKLTELGVSNIIPLKTERSIVRLDEKKLEKKYQRWNMICKEASEQSHRTKMPKIEKLMTLKQLTSLNYNLKLICSLNESTKPVDYYLTDSVNDILFVIGPEGGLSNKEEEILMNNDFKPVTLGKRVMRVETAAIYVASIINYIYKG